jgi:TM2 domain/Double zinc ribbon
MFCRHCANEVSDKAIMCVACGTPPLAGDNFCYNCKAATVSSTSICMKCGVGMKNTTSISNEIDGKDWTTALILCLFLGLLGVHRFYTKNTGIGVIQLLTFGGFGIWVLLDFISILTNSFKDADGKLLIKK